MAAAAAAAEECAIRTRRRPSLSLPLTAASSNQTSTPTTARTSASAAVASIAVVSLPLSDCCVREGKTHFDLAAILLPSFLPSLSPSLAPSTAVGSTRVLNEFRMAPPLVSPSSSECTSSVLRPASRRPSVANEHQCRSRESAMERRGEESQRAREGRREGRREGGPHLRFPSRSGVSEGRLRLT